jgi:hypothetical protein
MPVTARSRVPGAPDVSRRPQPAHLPAGPARRQTAMKMKHLLGSVSLCALLSVAQPVRADVTVGVDPGAPWIGYMNVFDLNWNYLWGSPWGTADLNAAFAGDVLTLEPNYSIARDVPPTDSYWWKPDGTGNKMMDANFYVEDSATLPGQKVTFTGRVLSNTLDQAYAATAFIKDFAPDYSWHQIAAVDLLPGDFAVTLQTLGPGRHVQYGFEVKGRNARLEDRNRLGNVKVTAAGPVIPEPSAMALLASGGLGLFAFRRRR